MPLFWPLPEPFCAAGVRLQAVWPAKRWRFFLSSSVATQRGGLVTLQNRIAVLSEDAAAIPAPFRPEEFALTECSDTEFCEWVARPSRRLRLMWNPSALNEEAPMGSHDQRLACVRRVVHRERRDRGSPGSISSLWSSNVLGSSTWEERRPEKCESCEGQSSKCPSRCGLLQRAMKNVPYWDG